MGLKFKWEVWDKVISTIKLKSDQNGVEIGVFSSPRKPSSPIKIRPKWGWNELAIFSSSNFNCIKIRPKWGWNAEKKEEEKEKKQIKIRPKWGWNFLVQSLYHLFSRLKSDQNGVEINSSLCRCWASKY